MPISDAATASTTLCCWTASTIRRSSRDSCRCLSRSARFLIRSLPGARLATAAIIGPGGSPPLVLHLDDDLERTDDVLPLLPALPMLRDEDA